MKKRLMIVCAGPLGRMVFNYARDLGMDVGGFLDSRPNVLTDFVGYPPVVAAPEDYSPVDGDVFIVAVGDAAARRHYVEVMAAKGGEFASVVHPLAYIGMGTVMGEGAIVGPHASILNNVTIGRHVLVGLNAGISHDCRIGDFVSISPGCRLTGGVVVGDGSFFGVQSSVVPHCELGLEAPVYVAAGAVVTKSFTSGRVMGVPAVRK